MEAERDISYNHMDVIAAMHITGSNGKMQWWCLSALASVASCEPRFVLQVVNRLLSDGRAETFTNRLGLRLWRLKE